MPASNLKIQSKEPWLQAAFKQEGFDLRQLRSMDTAAEKVGGQILKLLQQHVAWTGAAPLRLPGEGWRDAGMTALAGRSKLLIDDALAALDKITELGGDRDQPIVPLKNTIRMTLRALREELIGEQIPEAVKEIFERLLGPKDTKSSDCSNSTPQYLIFRIQKAAGLTENNVFGEQDEVVLAAFYTVKDHLECLRLSWDELVGRSVETGQTTSYRIARISAGLSCGLESVQQIEEVLTDANLSRACLDTLSFVVSEDEKRRTIGDILGLVERGLAYSLETLRENGRIGLGTVIPLIRVINDEVRSLLTALSEEANNRTSSKSASNAQNSQGIKLFALFTDELLAEFVTHVGRLSKHLEDCIELSGTNDQNATAADSAG